MPVSIGIDQAAAAMTGNARSSPLRQLLAEPLMKNNVVAIVNSYALGPFIHDEMGFHTLHML
jgi:hypothetical protein